MKQELALHFTFDDSIPVILFLEHLVQDREHYSLATVRNDASLKTTAEETHEPVLLDNIPDNGLIWHGIVRLPDRLDDS